MIKALPVPFLAYESKAPYIIIDQNAAHAKVSLTKPGQVIGRPFLEVFPDTSDEFKRTGKSAPIESIKKIVVSKRSDSLGEYKWDVPSENGYTTKYWRANQYPIFNDTNEVIAVYQLTEDITEQRIAEKQLALTKYQLDQTLVDGLVGTWVWDIKGKRVFGGPNLSNMFGLDPHAASLGLALDDFTKGIHEADRARVLAEIEHAVSTQARFESEYRTIDKDGSVRWLIARGRVETDESGNLDRFPGVVIDITERKMSEGVLLDSEARLRFMADSMPQLVWVARPDGFHEYYNQQWYDYTGTTPGTTDGDGWSNLFYIDDKEKAWKLWRKSLKTGEPYEIEYRLYHAPTNTYRWVIGRALPFRDADGTILKWYGTCTDIDEQRRMANQQAFLSRASKELTKSLDMRKMLEKITQMSVPIISDWCTIDLYSESTGFEQVSIAHVDPNKIPMVEEYRVRNPIDINSGSVIPRIIKSGKPEIFEHITDEMLTTYIKDKSTLKFMREIGLCSMMVVPIKSGKKAVGVMSFVSTESGWHFTDDDYQMVKELAARLSLSITNAILYEDSVKDAHRRRELEKALRIEKQTLELRVKERTRQLQLTNQGLRDEIIRRQTAEKDLSEYSHELTRSNKELEDFAYVASHDLQEPLRKIQAFGNLLQTEYKSDLGEEGNDYLIRMQSAAGRMSTLITDLLTFSRVTRRHPENRDINLSELVTDVLSDLETRVKETGATVKVTKLPTVSADMTHMRQLFQNLIGNALKFHAPDRPPVVTVSSKVVKGGHQISVSDNGIGFDEKYLDRIFSVFQRLHERSSYEGTGIGLAVCRKIVERYDGTITATSKKNTGSTFIIWLPKVVSTKEKK